MWALRLSLRAYRDFYDHIWVMLLYTALWWLLLFTVVLAPAATLLLFRAADPRLGPWEERMTLGQATSYLWSQFGRGWKLGLATLPAIALIAFNLRFYGNSDGAFALLAPIWLLLLIAAICAFLVIFALGGVSDLPAGPTIKRGLVLTGIRFPAILLVVLITFVIPATLVTSLLYFLAPVALALPGLLAVAMTRLVLRATGEAVPDPNLPTEERLHEKRSD